MKSSTRIYSQLTPELVHKLNEEIDKILLEFPGGVTHRTRGQFIGRLKETIRALGIKGDAWLPEICKLRKI